MATTVTSSSVWSKPGAWALDSEQHEDELAASAAAATAAKLAEPPAAEFPSLSAAVVTGKPKKKLKQVLSLAEFSNYKPPSAASAAAADVVLPTGPRERTAEEIAESRRGGFRNYGGDRDRERESRPRVSREEGDMGPSRADENDDWSKGKKVSSFGAGSGPERDMGPSRADEVDDWSKGKKFGGFGGDRVDRREKVGFFNTSRADDADNWGAKKAFGSGLGQVDDRRRERRVGFEATGPGRDVDNWVKGKENGVGTGGGSRPRLNLQPRTLPIENIVVSNNNNDVVNDVNVNGNGNVSGGEEVVVVEVKPKANPFGAARPREEVLKEKGQDWKEIDEKLEAVKIKEGVERSSFESIGRRRGFGLGGASGGKSEAAGGGRSEAGAAAAAAGGGRSEAAAAGGGHSRSEAAAVGNGGENGSVRSWRKPDGPSYAAVAVAAPTTIATTTSSEPVEKTDEAVTTEKARADN